ncbi:MAG TPA: MFS transporter [Reyranella sp.]|nr:MFS transporter [Reyranella sp.]
MRSREADFWRLWYVGLVAAIVRWLEMVVVGVVVYDRTGSPFVVAVITMLRMVPMGLFGAVLGAVVERVDRRLALAALLGLMALTSGVLAVVAALGALEVWHLAVLSLVNGCGWATDNPMRRAMMGEAVGHERMGWAMSLDVGASNASRAVGPAIGGLLLVSVGIEGAFLLNVLLYATALAATLGVRRPIAAASVGGAMLARLREGLALAVCDRRLAGALLVTVIYNLFGWPFTSMIPVIGRDSLGLGPEGIGWLASTEGVGAFIGALVLALWLKPHWYALGYIGGLALYLAAVILFALAPSFAVAGAALLLTGVSGAAYAALQATIVYLAAPPDMRSRMLGVLSVCIGTGPLGFLWLGWLADRIGANQATAITAALGLLALAATRPLWRTI